MPAEIWNRFMKVAHKGVPVVGLPGVGSGVASAPALPAETAASRDIDQSSCAGLTRASNAKSTSVSMCNGLPGHAAVAAARQ
jgi:hypothetical protein